ncbi:MAG: hypothetical protein SV765_02105 [Pseudomonadota bacterium]|nr:hypothetical protein [Pseudomonadales bacterium]MDY6918987.1 hypothetical protein [Pseudomonadota bacterium]
MSFLPENYHLGLSLIAFASIIVFQIVSRGLGKFIPVFGRAAKLNKESYDKKMQRKLYSENQKLNRNMTGCSAPTTPVTAGARTSASRPKAKTRPATRLSPPVKQSAKALQAKGCHHLFAFFMPLL